jgi:CheY-like chemotaxis protein
MVEIDLNGPWGRTGQSADTDLMAETRVLVVDDSPELRELLSFELTLAGYEVVEVPGGVEALQVPVGPDDIVLLDVMMPRIDGFAVLAAFRRRGGACQRVVFLTAKAESELRHRALARGADGFLAKPFVIEDIISEIERVMALPESERCATGA